MPKAPEPSSTCQKTTKSLPRISPKSYRHNAVPNHFSSRFLTSLTNGSRSLSQVKLGTHSAFRERSHTRAYTAKQGVFQMGGGITTLGLFHTFRKSCVAGYQNGKLCRFWVLVGCAPEERREPSEQRCAYARRCSEGVAAPLGCVILLPLLVQPDLLGWKDLTKRSGRVTITRNNRTDNRLALVWKPFRAVK